VCQHIPPAGEERPNAEFSEVFTWDRGRLKAGSNYSISKSTLRQCGEGENSDCSEPEAGPSDSTFPAVTQPLGCRVSFLPETNPSPRVTL